MSKILKIICLAFVFLLPLNAYADSKKVSVSARIKYDGEYSEDVREDLIIALQKKAVKKASSKFPKAKKKLIRQMKDEFYSDDNLEAFVTELKIQREKHDEKKKVLRIKAIAIVDTTEMQAMLETESESAGGAESKIGVIAIVSRQTSIKEFKARQVNIKAAEFQKVAEEKGGASTTSAISSTSKKAMAVTESGGSTTSKAAEMAWVFEADASTNAVSIFNSKLKDLGFKARKFRDIGRILDMDYTDIEKLATAKGSIRGKHLGMFEDAAEETGWDLFGYARIQLGKAEKNPVNGMYRVPAVVQFEVSKNDDGWENVGSVRQTPAYGEAKDELTATTLAVNNAVDIAMENVLAQLQEGGVL
jgi:uncharacterized protein YdbL (DUF1318 family)